jgi:hypothetical protein
VVPAPSSVKAGVVACSATDGIIAIDGNNGVVAAALRIVKAGVIACLAASEKVSKAGVVTTGANNVTDGTVAINVKNGKDGVVTDATDGNIAKAGVVPTGATTTVARLSEAKVPEVMNDVTNATDGNVAKAGVVPTGATTTVGRLSKAKVPEVLKDGDVDEPDWFNFPGREEVEKVLPKKYWAKPPNPGKMHR